MLRLHEAPAEVEGMEAAVIAGASPDVWARTRLLIVEVRADC